MLNASHLNVTLETSIRHAAYHVMPCLQYFFYRTKSISLKNVTFLKRRRLFALT